LAAAPLACSKPPAQAVGSAAAATQAAPFALTTNAAAAPPPGAAVALPPISDAPNAAGYRWRAVKMGGGGFVSGLVPSRTVAGLWYARTDVGGAYRWSAASQVWTPLLDWVSEEETGFLGVESIALDAHAPERLYLLVGISYFNAGKSAILRSRDFGASFETTLVTSQFTANGNGMGRQSGERLAVDPADGRVLLAATRDRGLFRSADYGASWQRLSALDVTSTPNGNGIAFVLFDPATATSGGPTSRIYVGVSRPEGANLYVSKDAGQSFAPVAGAPAGFTPQRAALSSAGVLHVTYGNGPGPHPSKSEPMDRGALWKLDTSSGVWSEISPLRGAQSRAFGGISVDAQNPRHLLTSTINTYQPQPWGHGDRIFSSEDGGQSWSDLIGSQRVRMAENGFPWIKDHAIHWAGSIEIDPFEAQRAFVTSGNGVFMTEDLGATPSTWKFAVNGLEETVPLDAASLPGGPLISVIGDYDGFVHTDLSTSPERGLHSPSMGTTWGLAVAAKKPEIVARLGSEIYLSRDRAEHWTKLDRPSADKGGHLALSADGAVLLWSVNSVVQRSPTSATSWSRVQGLGFDAAPTADSVDASRFYAYDPGSGGFYASHDGGRSFARSAMLEPGGAPRIRSMPGVAGDVWVPLHGKGLTRSKSAGSEFEPVASVLRCTAIGFGVAAPGKSVPAVYMWGAPQAGPVGVYRSDDEGKSWLRVNDDAHEYGGPANGQFVLGDANVYGRVYLSSAGRGLLVGTPER
jgi:xyloglucan-specific exo-beta-1,4-glucanase